MSLSTYGKSIRVYDFTFTSDGDGVATQAMNIDGEVVRVQIDMTGYPDEYQGQCSFEEEDGRHIIGSCFPSITRLGCAMYGPVVAKIYSVRPSTAGRCRVYVR